MSVGGVTHQAFKLAFNAEPIIYKDHYRPGVGNSLMLVGHIGNKMVSAWQFNFRYEPIWFDFWEKFYF